MTSRELLKEALLPCPIDQTEFGPQGNCQSACLAMLLGISLSDVPNFAAMEGDDNEKYVAQAKWLHDRGWALLTIVRWQTLPWPPTRGFYIAGGESERGHRHAVIYRDGQLWHDPHSDHTGIKSVDDIDFLYPLNPCAPPAVSGVPEGYVLVPEVLLWAEETVKNYDALIAIQDWSNASELFPQRQAARFILSLAAGKEGGK